jgi:hypothetical protein
MHNINNNILLSRAFFLSTKMRFSSIHCVNQLLKINIQNFLCNKIFLIEIFRDCQYMYFLIILIIYRINTSSKYTVFCQYHYELL